MDEIEFEEPQFSTCDCCGAQTTRLTRFVHRRGDAFAIYKLVFSDGPEHFWIDGIAIFGDWGEEATPAQRVGFTFRIWSVDSANNVGIVDAPGSPWEDVSALCALLTREQALQHPLKQQLFDLTDEIVGRDQPVMAFLAMNTLPESPAMRR